MFEDLESITPTSIGVASKQGAKWALQRGSAKIGSICLSNVLYSPKLTANLVSIGWLCDDGYHAIFRKACGAILNSKNEVFTRLFRNMKTH